MAAPSASRIMLLLMLGYSEAAAYFIIFGLVFGAFNVYGSVPYIKPSDIIDLVETQCVVVLFSSGNQPFDDVFLDLSKAFDKEDGVTMGRWEGTPNQFHWNRYETLRWVSKPPDDLDTTSIVVFERKNVDRSCLLTSLTDTKPNFPKAERYDGSLHLIPLLEFTNLKCVTYRNAKGGLSTEGLHRHYILENLFHVCSISSYSMGSWYNTTPGNCSNCTRKPLVGRELSTDDTQNICSAPTENHFNEPNLYKNNLNVILPTKSVFKNKVPTCKRIPVPTWETFFNDYVKLSHPVVIQGALQGWPAMKKWSTDYLRNLYGKKEVHIKLAPNGQFEGVEKSVLWENYTDFNIPDELKKVLPFSDLVVVRPATMNMNFSDFLDLIAGNYTSIKEYPSEKVSAYLEYSSITQYLPKLEEDIKPFPFVNNKLKRRHLNMWLSDGNTLGKLHFDPFDNLLGQIRGSKQLTLFEPHDNRNLYEAHIPEAILGFDAETGTFRRKTLLESTSMVMAPVDPLQPDFERFPNFAKVHPLNCTIEEGDVLFMPAFWWHEVQSYPNVKEHRNMAINFWYEPFLRKEFPCPRCQLDVNPYYRYLL